MKRSIGRLVVIAGWIAVLPTAIVTSNASGEQIFAVAPGGGHKPVFTMEEALQGILDGSGRKTVVVAMHNGPELTAFFHPTTLTYKQDGLYLQASLDQVAQAFGFDYFNWIQ